MSSEIRAVPSELSLTSRTQLYFTKEEKYFDFILKTWVPKPRFFSQPITISLALEYGRALKEERGFTHSYPNFLMKKCSLE